MRIATHHTRWIASGLLATTAILSLASVAFAGHGNGNGNGNGRRYKGNYGYSAPVTRRVIVERRDSGAGPALAGLIGGFILGTAVSRSQPVVVHREVYSDRDRDCDNNGYRSGSSRDCDRYGNRSGGYRDSDYGYYDPYSDNWYGSLSECQPSYRDRGSIVVIRVIDMSSGNCVRTMRYSNNNWQRFDEREWNDSRARNRDWRRSDGWKNRQDHGQRNDQRGDRDYDDRDYDRRGGDDN